MTEVPAQTTDSTTEVHSQAEITPVTAAAPAVDNATLTPNNDQIASPQQHAEGGPTGEGVDDKSDYNARKAAFLTNPNASVVAPAPVVAPVVADEPAKAAPASQDDLEDAPLIVDGAMPKMRVRTVTPVDVQAVAEFQASQKAGNKQSLVEFIAERFVPKLPGTEPVAATAPAETTPSTQTLEQVTAELARLEAERDSLQEDFEFEQAKELKPKLAELRQLERELLLKSVAANSEQAQEQAAAEEPFLIRAAQMFPQSVQADSALAAKAREVYAQWTADKDPRAAHPSGAFYCYVDAAAELGIQPASAAAAPTTVTPQTSPPSPVNRPPVSALIAGGGARTIPRTPDTAGMSYEQRKRAHLAATAS